ncbi:nuclear transport factor 2 family protein [Pseudonocardia sp. DR1-2]|uniref:nuclear transport factor 2 family protein n=1 Tax=Pseudonocardia sp. DR1-2 TaxID=2951168 RepID=UPI002044601F|nr:nuclear transport factor 2 family protein [Pseudonocardia sp. DR1-2]MCM3849677.1 nuclear transport factor 2 family protein [Pseudonocardia sp. DR1-2]
MAHDTSTDQRTPAQHALAEHLRLLTAGELDRHAALFSDDCVFTFPFAEGMATELHGREAVAAHMRNFPEAFDTRADPPVFVETASPDVAVATFVLRGTARPTGRPFEQHCIGVAHTDHDGRITRFDDYWNPLVAMRALATDGAGADGVSEVFAR